MKKKKVNEKDVKTIKIALYENELYGKEEQMEERVQFVIFSISDEWYGIEIEKTREIVSYPRITYLPHAPKHIAGIINLKGNILSVIDLKKVFGLPDSEMTQKGRIIVVESENIQAGILGDEVLDVVFIPKEKIEPPLAILDEEKAVFIDGGFRIDKKFAGVLNIEKIIRLK